VIENSRVGGSIPPLAIKTVSRSEIVQIPTPPHHPWQLFAKQTSRTGLRGIVPNLVAPRHYINQD
jgi:hypothetical protein